MVKTKELIICIISVFALVLTIATNAFATNTPDIEIMLGGNNTTNNVIDDEFTQVPETTNQDNNLNNTNNNLNNVNNTTNTSNTTDTTNTIPYTGVSYSSLVIIAVAGISAIYAYKKIKEYNV